MFRRLPRIWTHWNGVRKIQFFVFVVSNMIHTLRWLQEDAHDVWKYRGTVLQVEANGIRNE